jgi:hypothetical protein
MSWRTVTSTIDLSPRASRPASAGHHKKPIRMTQQDMDHATDNRRKGVRRTVTILVVIVAVSFLVSFLQIVLMK